MMHTVSQLGHKLWFEAQVGAPSLIQKTMINPVVASKELVRLALNPFFSLSQLQGQNQAGTFTTTYCTTKELRSSSQFKGYLFSESSTATKLDRRPIWQLRQLATITDSDMIMVEAGKQIIRKLPRHKALVIPLRLYLLLDVRGSWAEVKQRFHKTVYRNELRLIQKNGYTHQISHNLADFDDFYHHMYVPTMADRHGNLNTPLTRADLLTYLRYGFLFLIRAKDNQPVAGGLCHTQEKVLTLIASGVLNADECLRKEGALGALRAMLLEHAAGSNFETCSFGECAPFLDDGIFQYKRKWGAQIAIRNRRVWLKINHLTPALAQFLQDNPIVIIDEKEQLHGLIVVDDPALVRAEQKAEWEKKYATPGLNSLLIGRVADFAA